MRLDEPLSAHYLPIKSQNCQERRLQVEHFTSSIPDAKYRLRKHGCLQKVNFRYFGLKSGGIFTFRLNPSSSSFSLFLSLFLVLGIYWASFPTGPHLCGKRFGELKTYGIRRKNCRWLVEDFHHHFRLNVTYFLSFYPASLT